MSRLRRRHTLPLFFANVAWNKNVGPDHAKDGQPGFSSIGLLALGVNRATSRQDLAF